MITDFHCCLVKNPDILWRGRATQEKNGIVTLLPPLKIYASNEVSIPKMILRAIKKIFEPSEILVDTKLGLRFLEKERVR